MTPFTRNHGLVAKGQKNFLKKIELKVQSNVSLLTLRKLKPTEHFSGKSVLKFQLWTVILRLLIEIAVWNFHPKFSF